MKEVNEQYCDYKFTKTIIFKVVGVDIASIPKIARLVNGCDRKTLSIVFSDHEQDYCQSVNNFVNYYALCFGIKEAVSKALGTGIVGIEWNEIEADLTKEPVLVRLSGKAKIQAQKLSIQKWLVDWWKWQDSVLVNVLGFSEEQINDKN